MSNRMGRKMEKLLGYMAAKTIIRQTRNKLSILKKAVEANKNGTGYKRKIKDIIGRYNG